MMTAIREVQVAGEDEGKRLDFYLAGIFAEVSRSQFKKMIEQGSVRIEGRTVSAHYPVKSGEKVCVEWPKKDAGDLEAEDISLEIINFSKQEMVLEWGTVDLPATGKE